MRASMAFTFGVGVGLVVLATVGRAPGTAPAREESDRARVSQRGP